MEELRAAEQQRWFRLTPAFETTHVVADVSLPPAQLSNPNAAPYLE